MIHIAICDDEPVQVRLLSQLVGDWFAGQGEACEILSYPSAEALRFFLGGASCGGHSVVGHSNGANKRHGAGTKAAAKAKTDTNHLYHRNAGLCL